MWRQINKMRFGFVFLFTINLLSLNVMAKDGELSKEVVFRTESKIVDAWQIVCSFGEKNQKLGCAAILKITQKVATQKVTTNTSNEKTQESIVMLWQVSKSANGSFFSTIQTPTGVVIKPGLKLKLANAQAEITLPYMSCNQQACLAGAMMDDNFIKQVALEQKVDILLQGFDGKVYTYNFSPKGIDKALGEIK